VKVHFLQDALGCNAVHGPAIKLMKRAGVTVEIFRFVHFSRIKRFIQAQLFTSAEWRAAIANDTPLILLGDFNSLRSSRPYRTLNRHLRDVCELVQPTTPIRTFPTIFSVSAVDHIFVNEAVRSVSASVHRSRSRGLLPIISTHG